MINKKLCSAIFALSLASCGGGSDDDSSTEPTTNSPDPMSTSEPTPEPTATATSMPTASPDPTETPEPPTMATPMPIPTVEPVTLTQLQSDIFGRYCIACHFGGSAPQGLRLDSEENTFDHTVNIPSNQQPELLLVEPGNPDESYLVHKVEGRDTISGDQMPRFGPPLSNDEIDMIRSWIANGANGNGSEKVTTEETISY